MTTTTAMMTSSTISTITTSAYDQCLHTVGA